MGQKVYRGGVVMRRHLVLRVSQGMAWCVVWLSQGMDLEVSHIRVCRLSGKGKALGGVATFAGVGLEIVALLARFNSFDVHLMF